MALPEVFVGGVALFTVASLTGGLAAAPGVLLAARAVQGAGAALAAPNMMALIAANFAEGAPRTRALAVFSSVSGMSLPAGLILGGLLTSLVSWRWVMFVNVPAGAAIVALGLRYVRPVPKLRTGLDMAGAVIGTTGMTSSLGLAVLVTVFGTAVRDAAPGLADAVTSSFAAASTYTACALTVALLAIRRPG